MRLQAAWLHAHAEWGPGLHEDGFGLSESDETVSAAGFSAWVARLISAEDSCTTDDPSVSGCIHRWIIDGDDVFGGIALRYGDSEFIRSAGHIGYGIRPSARRRGLASLALGRTLNEAGRLGINCFSSAMPATSPQPPRSNATEEYSRASKQTSTAKHGATGSLPPSWSGTVQCIRSERHWQSVLGSTYRLSTWPRLHLRTAS
jgi:hypothetical protein